MNKGVVLHHPHNQREREFGMNVLHLLVSGGIGGIEILMKNYAQHSKHNNIFVFTWKAGEIAETMERDGARIYTTDAGREGIYATLKRIRHICLTEKIDIVVSHNSAPLLKLALIYIKITLPHVHVVAYAHANAKDICDHSRKRGLLRRKLVHWLGFQFAEGIIAISQSVKESLHDYLHINPQKVQRIYNGTPVGLATDKRTVNIKDAGLRLIYVGRLIPEKGVQETLRALAHADKRIPFTFTIVGDGPYRKNLERLTTELKMSDRVCFLGQRSDVNALLRDADVFIHFPVWEEGFGITVIEAMSSGVVCVVNNRGAMTEIIEDGVNGFIVDSNDVEALGDILRKLMEMSPMEWERLRENALQKAELFSVERFAENLDCYLLGIK